MRRTTLAMTILILSLAAVATPARGASFGWVPDSAGLPPLVTLNEDEIGWIHVTRRLVAQENVPGRMLLGHGLSGLYQSVAGGGWISLTPGCVSPVRPPVIEDAIGTLSACGVEGIAADPHDPLSLAVSAYNLDLLAPGIPVNQGGVFTSRTGGLSWRKALPGVRGNALAMRRDSLLDPATLVAGRIQRTLTDVGTDSNSFCRAVLGELGGCPAPPHGSLRRLAHWTPISASSMAVQLHDMVRSAGFAHESGRADTR
jgi:hypothetical protein